MPIKIRRKQNTHLGGKRPDLSINESWIGKIPYSLPNETYPIDCYQDKMYATMILNLTQIPFVPEAVKNMKVMAVFLSPNFAKDLSSLSGNFRIREYGSLEELVPNEMSLTFPDLKSFPLIPRLLFGNIEKQTKQHFKKFIFHFGVILNSLVDGYRLLT